MGFCNKLHQISRQNWTWCVHGYGAGCLSFLECLTLLYHEIMVKRRKKKVLFNSISMRAWRYFRHQPWHHCLKRVQKAIFPSGYLQHSRFQQARNLPGSSAYSYHQLPYLHIHSHLPLQVGRSYNSHSYQQLESSPPFPAHLLGAGLVLYGNRERGMFLL